MTTKEQWKAGILVTGMLVIATVVNSRWPDRNVGQAQVIPYRPPPPQQISQPAAPVEPQYPMHKLIPVNQAGWSEEISFNGDEHLDWDVQEDDVWLDNKVNRIEEFRSFPKNDTRFRRRILHESIRTFQFRVTPGTPVQEGTVEITVQKNVPADFNTRENLLAPVSPQLTASGVKAAARWPSGLTPTRYGKFPPDGMGPNSGNIAVDTVYPIEDVLYRIMRGWNISPFTDDGKVNFETAQDQDGFRLRILNPDTPIVVKFKMTREQTKDASVSAQRPPANQGIPNGNPKQIPPSAPRTFYRTSPGGSSYYPASPQPRRPLRSKTPTTVFASPA